MTFLKMFSVLAALLNECARRMYKLNGRRGFALALALALAAMHIASSASAATIDSGFSAMWFDPARNGEGLQLEILSPDYALVEWFTYDEQGGQRWLQSVGNIVHGAAGDSIEFSQLNVTHGGHFGPGFNPADVVIEGVGSATLLFTDCNTGTFHYDAFGQSQTLPMQRLTQTMGAGCTPINGVPGQPVMPYAGQSGSWFDVSHNGEGFDLQWMSSDLAIIEWYTYDTHGNQVWLQGAGTEQDDGSITFVQMVRTHGPHFGISYDQTAFQAEDWGTLTLQLDCNIGTAHYESKQAEFGSGDLTLTRLTKLVQPDCPTVKPKLSDLYTITWNEIPIAEGTAADPNFLGAESIANDGTIAGDRNGHLVLWHPDVQTWEDVPRELATQPVDISPDGYAVIATDELDADPIHTIMWQRSTGWEALPGDLFDESIHYGVSHNFKYVIGTGGSKADGPVSAWIRAVDGTQQILPSSDAIHTGIPYAVSDAGGTVVGVTLRFPAGLPELVAVRWETGGQPTIIHNPNGEELAVASACDANCSIIFGAGLYNYVPNHPHPGEAWFLKSDGTFEYLGALADALLSARSYSVSDATPDGSLAVGAYQISAPPGYPASTISRPFLWTEATGIVSVRSLVDELGFGDDDWDEMSAVQVSADGRKILLSGLHRLDLFPIGYSRAVVLELVPKSGLTLR